MRYFLSFSLVFELFLMCDGSLTSFSLCAGCTIGGHLQKPPHKLLTWNAMCNFMVICNLTALFFFAEYLFHFIYAIDDGAN
jgi:hypothetical protein